MIGGPPPPASWRETFLTGGTLDLQRGRRGRDFFFSQGTLDQKCAGRLKRNFFVTALLCASFGLLVFCVVELRMFWVYVMRRFSGAHFPSYCFAPVLGRKVSDLLRCAGFVTQSR